MTFWVGASDSAVSCASERSSRLGGGGRSGRGLARCSVRRSASAITSAVSGIRAEDAGTTGGALVGAEGGAAPNAVGADPAAPADPAPGAPSQTITVVYTDAVAVDPATIDAGDILVTGPGDVPVTITAAAVDSAVPGTPRIATEAFLPLSYRQDWFFAPHAGFSIRNLPQIENERQVGEAVQSSDLDFIVVGSATRAGMDTAMASVGFVRRRDRYVHPRARFYVEFPRGPLAIGGEYRIRAVINDPERCAASITTTPSDAPEIRRLRRGKSWARGTWPSGISEIAPP